LQLAAARVLMSALPSWAIFQPLSWLDLALELRHVDAGCPRLQREQVGAGTDTLPRS
jgi:hypothetical protein